MIRPKLLVLFCGAGGGSMGYHRAGFDVTGVDIHAQPRYPFEFHRGDAMEIGWYVNAPGLHWQYDAIHASPPCQAYTLAQRIQKINHPDLIGPVRRMLQASGVPWVIENVPGAPLRNPITLCGGMFGLGVDRDRLFESSIAIPQPPHPTHRPTVKMGRPPEPDKVIQVVGHFSGVQFARDAMGIDWMTRDELKEAVPPAYLEYVGKYLMEAIT